MDLRFQKAFVLLNEVEEYAWGEGCSSSGICAGESLEIFVDEPPKKNSLQNK